MEYHGTLATEETAPRTVFRSDAGLGSAGAHRDFVDIADQHYNSELNRKALAERCIKSLIAGRRTEHGSGLGKTRRVVERTITWLHQSRRLRVGYERLDHIHEAFLKIGCALVGWRFLKKSQSSFC